MRGLSSKTEAHLSIAEEKEVQQEKTASQGGEAARPTSSALSSSEDNSGRGRQEGMSAGGLAGAGGLRLPDRQGPRTGKSPGPRPRSRETTQATDKRRSSLGRATSEDGSAAGGWHLAHTH